MLLSWAASYASRFRGCRLGILAGPRAHRKRQSASTSTRISFRLPVTAARSHRGSPRDDCPCGGGWRPARSSRRDLRFLRFWRRKCRASGARAGRAGPAGVLGRRSSTTAAWIIRDNRGGRGRAAGGRPPAAGDRIHRVGEASCSLRLAPPVTRVRWRDLGHRGRCLVFSCSPHSGAPPPAPPPPVPATAPAHRRSHPPPAEARPGSR